MTDRLDGLDLAAAAPFVDADAVRQMWAAQRDYDVNRWLLPLPPWAKRRYDDPGPRAWESLRRRLAADTSQRPFCIYLHVPFCSRKCGFCDSYSFKLGAQQAGRIEDYVNRLCDELRLWGASGGLARRPVSTVHLGGGTPTFLGEAALRRIAACCRSHFNTGPETEWALESTVEALTPGMVAAMHEMGFRRLHLGIQSLQDEVRAAIGRRRSAAEALAKIRETRALGWVVSVDMICGLPFQTLAGFMDGLAGLVEAGVNGVSLYELLIYRQNRRWAEQHGLTGRSHVSNYGMFLAGAFYLEGRGFRKNLFNHWADALDTNVYFTFPQRGEDLLAVGATADGVFGDYHYRHPRYAAYMDAPPPGLEGGLSKTAAERTLWPLMTAILSGRLSAEKRAELENLAGESLLRRWMVNRLVVPTAGGLELTPAGSWFAGNMLAELAEAPLKIQPGGSMISA
jgi:coproporphyrinogen III oxidase-like Fe-S oxidoreductase